MQRRLLLSVGLSLSLISCTTIKSITQKTTKAPVEPKVCNVIRGAFDIGSGATRLKVADVDRCQNKINKILLEREEKVSYKEDLNKHGQNFSQEIQNQGEEVLKKLKTEGDALKVQEYVGVATSAFRDAKNAKPFVEKLNLDLQINAQIVTQDEEAMLGFFAASQSLQTTPENTLIWDIGGGSQQMIHYKGKNKFITYEGKLASVSFKEYVLKHVVKKQGPSPNPLNSYQIKVSVEYAKDTARRTVKRDIRDFLLTHPDASIIGIGGVHYFSIRQQIDPSGQIDSYTLDDVEKVLKDRIGAKDEDLGDAKYAETQVTNLALVDGYMKALQIKKVRVVNANLSDGLLLNFKYWTP